MLVKGIIDEDFVNYKVASMFISFHSCTFKCDKMCGKQVCQNSTLATSPDIDVDIDYLVNRYIDNPITKAVVLGGLEPFDDIGNMLDFISLLRSKCDDDVVIYTGYTENEIKSMFNHCYNKLKSYNNIIIKYGRFIPDEPKHYDSILGVNLASSNQYARMI